jgi:hypothetical protein
MDVSLVSQLAIHFPLAGYVVHNQRFSYGVASYNQVADGWKPTTWYSWSLIMHYLVHIRNSSSSIFYKKISMIWQFLLIALDPLIQTTPSGGTSPYFQEYMDFPMPRAFSPKLLLQYIYRNFWFCKMIKKVIVMGLRSLPPNVFKNPDNTCASLLNVDGT